MLPYLLLILLLPSSAAQFFWPVFPGEIKTDNTLVYVGENITLHCFKKSPFAADVQFKMKDMKVPSEYVKVINTTYARMDRPATSADDRELVFSCLDAELIALQTVYIEYRPQKVSQLQIVYYDKTTAFFSWDLGLVKYKYQPDPNTNVNRPVTVVTANYTFDNITWDLCPPASTTSREAHTSCQMKTYIAGSLWLRVTVQNMFRGDTAEEVFYIDNLYNYVKPKPVVNLAWTIVNSTAVYFNWTMDRSELGAEVTYRHLDSPQAKLHVVEVPTDETNVVIRLHPFYTYAFQVRAKPSRGHLSEPVNVTIKMPEDAPASGPVVLKGGYSRNPCFSERQDVYVYFQPVAENDQNGLIVNHSAEFHADSLTWSNWRPVSEGLLVQARIPCKSRLNVTLYALTGVGRSPPSFMSIPPEAAVADLSAEVSKLDLQVGRLNASQMLMHWNPAAELPDYNLFLYYCLKMYSPSADCKDPLQFMELDATAGSYLLDANGTEFQNGRFGFAVITPDGRQSGITFTECIYTVNETSDNAPDKPVATAGEDYIQLSWQGIRCDGRRVVHGYILQVCREAADMADCSNEIHVDGGNTNTYRLENVDPGIKYHIRLAASTSSGRTAFSEPVSAEANPKSGISGLATEDIVGIAVGILVILIILGSVIFCACRRYWKEEKKKFKGQVVKKPRPIRVDNPPQLPDRNINENASNLYDFINTNIGRQLSEDSGVSSGDNRPTLPDSPAEQNSLTESENPDYVDEGSRGPCDSSGTETTNFTVMPAAACTPCTVNSQAVSSGVCAAGGGTEQEDVSGTQDEASESQRVGPDILSAVDESVIEASGKSSASFSQQANARLVQSPVLGSGGERMQPDQFVVDNTPLQDDVERYIWSAVPGDLEGYVRSAVADDLEGYVRSAVAGNLEGYVRSAVAGDLEGYVRSAVAGDLEGYVRSAVPDDVYPQNVNNIGVYVQCGQQEPPTVADVFGPTTTAGRSVHHHRYLENPPIDIVPPASRHNTTPMTDSGPSSHNTTPMTDSGPSSHNTTTMTDSGPSSHNTTTMTDSGPSSHNTTPMTDSGPSSHNTTPMTDSGPSSHNTTTMTDSGPSTVNSVGAYVQCGQQEPPPVADVFRPTTAAVGTQTAVRGPTVTIVGTMTFAGPFVHHHRYLENTMPPASSHNTTPMTDSGPSTNDDSHTDGEEEEEESSRNDPCVHAACKQYQ